MFNCYSLLFPFEFARICLAYRLLDGDVYKNWRCPLRFDAFGGFWVEMSIKNLKISIEI